MDYMMGAGGLPGPELSPALSSHSAGSCSAHKLFIGNLSYGTGTSRLRDAFKTFDGFVSCKVSF